MRDSDPFKPTFLKRDADSLCELQASRLRPEVGSREAHRRQPTCHYVQVLIGSTRPERGILICIPPIFFHSFQHPWFSPVKAETRGFFDFSSSSFAQIDGTIYFFCLISHLFRSHLYNITKFSSLLLLYIFTQLELASNVIQCYTKCADSLASLWLNRINFLSNLERMRSL